MKRLLLTPLMVMLAITINAQTNSGFPVVESVYLTPDHTKVSAFEKNMAEHNKMYHSKEENGCRVYYVMAGTNAGKYVWVRSTSYADMDARGKQSKEHDDNWNNMIMPTLEADNGGSYWRFYPELSNMKSFTLDKLDFTFYDVKRGFGNFDKVKAILAKLAKMNKMKYPNDVYGLYVNQFNSTKDGRDFCFVNFYNSFSKLGEEDDTWIAKYDEVNGAGSFEKDVNTWNDLVIGSDRELWIFNPELSGISGDVKVE